MKTFISILVLFLTTNSLARECPLLGSLIWEISNVTADCPINQAYHCRKYNGKPMGFCHVILDCPPGTFADLVKDAPSPKLQCVACPDDRFDPSRSRSNEISECQYIKQKCLQEDHKILWRQGSSTSDNICYCDYKSGFDMDADEFGVIPNTDIKICDGSTRCVCRQALGCNVSPNVCILPDKSCAKQCPPGFTRPDFSFKCVPKDVTTLTTPGTMPTSPFTVAPVVVGVMPETPKPTEETPQNTPEKTNWSPLFIAKVVLGCAAVVLIIIVIVIVILKIRSRQCNGQHRPVPTKDTQ